MIVALFGEVDPITGFVYDLSLLRELINQEVEEPFDHKNLNIEVVQFLIDNKYDVNFQNKDGNTILHLMAMGIVEKNLQSTETYIEKKEHIKRFPDTYVKAQEQVKRLKTNFKNYSKIAKLLLQNGADTKLKNNAGKTPLMIANENNTDTMLEVLKNAKQ